MPAISIQPTYPVFTETDGLPLENGYIWIGAANLDPQGNPINVYWDAALTIAAPQPIRTLNGYPSRNGTPGRLYVNSDYSIRVQNSKGSLVYSAPAATERISSNLVTYQPPFTGSVATTVQDKLAQTVSVMDFGADATGATDSSLAIQAAINAAGDNGCVFVPDGTYVAENIYVDFDNIQIDCRGVFDMTGKSTPLFILGQQANGSASSAARININIRGLATTGDRTSGSKAVYFRRCSTSKLVDCRLWSLDTAFDGEGYPGFTYESLICEFHNLDIRQCNVGINDANGSFQASVFFHGRIENNQNEGVISNSPNISFIGTTIEGNNESNTAKPEIKWGSYGGALNLTDCYVECVRNATKAIEVVSGTGSCALTISGGSYFMNDAANRYLVTSARTSLSLTVIGGLYSAFKNWLSGTVSGDYSVMIRPAFTNVDPLITADATFTSDAAYYQYRRASGLVTNKNISVNSLFSAGNASLQGGLEKTFYVNGNTSATQIAVPVSQFSGTTTYLVEIVGVGRNGAASSGGFKIYVLRNGDGTIANYSVDYENGATGTALVAANNAGNIEIQGLATSRLWNFFSFIRGRI